MLQCAVVAFFKTIVLKVLAHRFFSMLACLGAASAVLWAAERPSPQCEMAPAVTPALPGTLKEQADLVLQAWSQFPTCSEWEEYLSSAEAGQLAELRRKIAAIRPCCEMLRALPPARRKALILQADAVLWQRQWLYGMYLGEYGIEVEAPFDVGLCDLSHTATMLKAVLNGKRRVTPEVQSVVQELVQMLGGEHVLDVPLAWQDEQLAEDYKTALQFYKDFCAAAAAPQEAQSLRMLQELLPVCDYFSRKGEGEIWRVNQLAFAFRTALQDLRHYKMAPYPTPVLLPQWRTPARMKALQSFVDTFPALQALLEV